MSEAERLDAIIDKLATMDKHTSSAHARIEGNVERIADRVADLAERVKIQNGRVNRLEAQMGDLQMHARIHDRAMEESDERTDAVQARMWSFVIGSGVAIIAGLLGYFL